MKSKIKYAFNPRQKSYEQVQTIKRQGREFAVRRKNSQRASVVVAGVVSPYITLARSV